MKERNENLKEKIINDIKTDCWQPHVVKLALAAKKHRKKTQSLDVAVVAQIDRTNYHDGLYVLFSRLQSVLMKANVNKKFNKTYEYRFQIAIYADNAHWMALDVRIRNCKPTFILMDSIQDKDYQNTTQKRIRDQFPEAIIYQLELINPLQNDGTRCSRFMLNNLYTLQKATTIYSELENIFQNSNEMLRKITLDNMPESLYKIVRSYAYVESIDDDIPEKIKTSTIKKSKQFPDKGVITMQDIFNLNIKTKGENTFNLYIDYKKERYELHILEYIKPLSNDEIQKMLEAGQGWEIINQICLDYNINSPDQSFYHLELKYSSWEEEKNDCKELVSRLIKSNNINAIKYMLEQNPNSTKLALKYLKERILLIPFEKNYSEIAEILINYVEKISTLTDNDDKNVLHLAIQNKWIDSVKVLMTKYPILIAKKDFNGDTILHYAINSNNLELCKLILNGIETHSNIINLNKLINIYNHDNQTPLILAIKNNNSDLVSLLFEKNAKLSSSKLILKAVRENNIEMVKVYMKYISIIKKSLPDILSDIKEAAGKNEEILKLINESKPQSIKTEITHTNKLQPIPKRFIILNSLTTSHEKEATSTKPQEHIKYTKK